MKLDWVKDDVGNCDKNKRRKSIVFIAADNGSISYSKHIRELAF